MALDDLQQQYIPKDNKFYHNHYHHVIILLMLLMLVMTIAVGVVFYQMVTRPLPLFNAIDSDNQSMQLIPYDEPNQLPDTIIRFASKAAALAYTFDYVNYNKQLDAAKGYFTADGWQDFEASIAGPIKDVVQKQLFVYSVVRDTPVIQNQGPLPGKGYVWRVQIPFLVTYQSADTTQTKSYMVSVSIVQVPTQINKAGIGIDQFVMRNG